jgi:RimJ/RimL family protein N-acetyltransferase
MTAAKCVKQRHFVRTGRLLFRTPTEWEMAAAQAAASDAAAQRWIGWSPESIVAPEDRRQYLAVRPGTGPDREWPGFACLVAIDPTVDRCAGMVAISNVPERGLEVGGWLAPAFRGRGLGTELFRAGLLLGHEHLGLARIRAGADKANVGSRRALVAAGFSPAEGPATYKLENGRETQACWYEHRAHEARRCPGPRLS